MTKAERKRAEITERLASYLLDHGLGSASLRPLAAAVGASDRMLIYYFGDKDGILRAGLTCVAQRMRERFEAAPGAGTPLPAEALLPALLAMVDDPEVKPYLRLWLEAASLAARGDRLCQTVGGEIARGYIDWIAQRVAAPSEASRREIARSLFRTVEGEVLLGVFGV